MHINKHEHQGSVFEMRFFDTNLFITQSSMYKLE
jgi:hypothetical protein